MSDKRKMILDLIKKHKLAVLSTVNSKGMPESAVIEFGETDNLDLIFDTFANFRKVKNMKGNPNVSIVIGWDENITIQYEGRAEELREGKSSEYKKRYFSKGPEARKWEKNKGIKFFKISPKWIRYSNLNSDPWDIFEINDADKNEN